MLDTPSIVAGKWHGKGSAAQLDATLQVDDKHFTLKIDGGRTVHGRLEELSVSDRLGNVERKLNLQDGSIFATRDNDAVDKLFNQSNRFNHWLHTLESHIAWVVVALIVTVVVSAAFFKWGLPWTGTKVAHALPHKTNELIGAHTFEFLDDYFFDDESTVDPERMAQIREHFKTSLVPLEEDKQGINYRLHFRKWDVGDKGIPNALALPSGDIILTDKFVELSQNQNEIDAVLLHEMGHIVHRHTLEMVVESTLLAAIVMLATGDANGIAELGLGLGTLLISSNYSRGHESEADLYAFQKMLKAGIDPQAFSDIMDRMNQYMEDEEENEEAENQNDSISLDEENQNKSIMDYLSSHPNTADRIRQARHYSTCYHKGLLECPILIDEL